VSGGLATISNPIDDNPVKIERIYSKKRTFAFCLSDSGEEIKEHNIMTGEFAFKQLFWLAVTAKGHQPIDTTEALMSAPEKAPQTSTLVPGTTRMNIGGADAMQQ